jgi:hypothetical protein
MGKLKNNAKMIALGEEIKSTKESLYKWVNTDSPFLGSDY